MLRRQRHREVHRAGLLRVGEGHGREVRVGVLLLAHHARRVEARGLEDLHDGGAADPVEGRVDDRQVARPVLGQLRHVVEVAVHDVLAQGPRGRAARQVGHRPHGGDPGGDLRVRGRDDLAAVAEVDLVAVVLGRVVAGRDHHAGRAAELADGVGEHRRRQRPGEQPDRDPGAGHHLGGVPGEVVAAVPGVLPDDHRAGGARVLEVRRQARRGPAHDHPVHPVRAGRDRAAQARGAELQRAGEAVRQVRERLVVTVLDRVDDLLRARPGWPRRGRRRSRRGPGRRGCRCRARRSCRHPRTVTGKPPVADLIVGLAERIGVPAFVAVCTDLMGGADREEYVEELRSLTGHDWHPGDGVFDRDVWHDYWVRTWGARGLLHVWDDSATSAVVAGLADEHWRPAEMCLKVTARHDVAGAGDAAAVARHARAAAGARPGAARARRRRRHPARRAGAGPARGRRRGRTPPGRASAEADGRRGWTSSRTRADSPTATRTRRPRGPAPWCPAHPRSVRPPRRRAPGRRGRRGRQPQA